MTSDLVRGVEAPDAGVDLRRVQRRVVASLLVVQTVFALVFAMTGPLISLIAERMTGSAGQAGFAQALLFCGGVLFSIPLAALSATRGRRAGIATGYLTGAAGSALVVISASLSSYPLLLVGAVAVGAALAAGFQARFGVTDLADADRIGRTMGLLSWSAIAGSVIGPPLSGGVEQLGGDRLAEFTAPFAAVGVGLAVAGTLVLVTLRPDPLLLARSLGREKVREKLDTRRALVESLRGPRIRQGIAVVVTVHATMISLMNMAPIHMSHGTTTLTAIGLVIGAHTAAMYIPGPLVGYLADRLGTFPLLVTSLGILVSSAVVLALSPEGDIVMVGIGLVLLGIGWSAGYLAGSVLITSAAEGQLRTMAQGASDFLVQLAAALGALSAGLMVAAFGYSGLSMAWCAILLALLVHLMMRRPASGPSPADGPGVSKG
ncbi:Predicted arabinose efflux permease, MFS family [Micromonospora nigra]|uniref:Predicted arabinose efflux permease, MFS family n=1 Tax=Micromonospora nigra TaxID=145857 RepID=A0A1C6SYF3_9ACTN|nr:MFS transporter [Micromonospora nigra]SCL34530.1 Predicted arabinose efflux permease, MFS family [Micromonospora nigra]